MRPVTLYPSGYNSTLLDIDALFVRHHVDKMHPEFARRLRAWLISMGGEVGIGGSWRDSGTQPDKPGFAPEGRSFHQYQRFASGLIKFAAVDLVRRDGPDAGDNHDPMPWHLAPVQGSEEAQRWGLHINVGVPGNGESWHLQPIEIDGWESWIAAGSPDPVANYPIPEDDMTPLDVPRRAYDSRKTGSKLQPGQTLTVDIGAPSAFVHLTAVQTDGVGYLTISGTDVKSTASIVNFDADRTESDGAPIGLPDGRLRVTAHGAAAHVIVDVFAEGHR